MSDTTNVDAPDVLTDLPPQEYLARARDILIYVANQVGSRTDLPLLVRTVLVERIANCDDLLSTVIDLLESPDEVARVDVGLQALLHVREA